MVARATVLAVAALAVLLACTPESPEQKLRRLTGEACRKSDTPACRQWMAEEALKLDMLMADIEEQR